MRPEINDHIIVPTYIGNGVYRVTGYHQPTQQYSIRNVDDPPFHSYDIAVARDEIADILPEPPAYKKDQEILAVSPNHGILQAIIKATGYLLSDQQYFYIVETFTESTYQVREDNLALPCKSMFAWSKST